MRKTDIRYQTYLKILEEELLPAMGCTEPIAVAYAAAMARDLLGSMPVRMEVNVSGNILKNVKSVVVPNTGGLRGIQAAAAAGAAVGSSRPVAETLKYVPLNRYVGMSGQKFTGNLYIACGISGAVQHLKGIKDASTIVAINKNAGAPIFKNCDYGIVGDVNEILPLLTAALDTGEKQPAPPMVKMKRPRPPKEAPIGKRYVCGGCGYEYVPELGDPDGEIAPGTLFEKLPEDWVCPECAEAKDQFIEA